MSWGVLERKFWWRELSKSGGASTWKLGPEKSAQLHLHAASEEEEGAAFIGKVDPSSSQEFPKSKNGKEENRGAYRVNRADSSFLSDLLQVGEGLPNLKKRALGHESGPENVKEHIIAGVVIIWHRKWQESGSDRGVEVSCEVLGTGTRKTSTHGWRCTNTIHCLLTTERSVNPSSVVCSVKRLREHPLWGRVLPL